MEFTKWIRRRQHACVSDAINNRRNSNAALENAAPPRDIDVLAIRKACERFGYGQSTFAGPESAHGVGLRGRHKG
jgi:hypothetical protein